MLKSVYALLSPAGVKARLSVFILHRVLPVPDPLFPNEIHASRFDELCGWIKGWCNVLPLDHAVASLKAGTLPARAACITFDDGYADNFKVALPILQRHGLAATFFIATGFLDGGRMWNDSVIESIRLTQLPILRLDDLFGAGFAGVPVVTASEKSAAIGAIIGLVKYRPVSERASIIEQLAERSLARLPVDLMMTSTEVRAMRQAGMQIGAHTVSHPILARLDPLVARAEIGESKRVLEKLLDERVGLFAYPNGKPDADYNVQSASIVRELGFDAAFSTRWAASRADTDIFQIPRFTPWDRTRWRFGARMLANLRVGHGPNNLAG